jgi:hypothetical protein
LSGLAPFLRCDAPGEAGGSLLFSMTVASTSPPGAEQVDHPAMASGTNTKPAQLKNANICFSAIRVTQGNGARTRFAGGANLLGDAARYAQFARSGAAWPNRDWDAGVENICCY